MKIFSIAALTAALVAFVGVASAQVPPPPVVVVPPVEPWQPPPITPVATPVTAGTIFASNGIYGQITSPAWPVATIAVGTTLTYTLSELFTFDAVQAATYCSIRIAANATALDATNGNAYGGTYTANAGASVNVGIAIKQRILSWWGITISGTGGTDVTTSGNSNSTVAFTFNAPGIYAIGIRPKTDSNCGGSGITMVNPNTNQQTAATAIVQVVSAADYALPETGWYWDPNQGGRGVAIEYYPSNSRIFMGIFGYGSGGESSWLVGACTYNAAARTCSGNLDMHRGGVTLAQIEGPLAQYVGSTGQFTLTFNQRNQPTLQWTGPTINLIRYKLTGAATAANAVSGSFPGGAAMANGWYWNASTGGRGWFVETARTPTGGLMTFTVGFMYRPDGSPVWYALESGSTATAAPALFEGASFKEFAGGSSMTDQTWSPTITNTDRGAGSLLAGNSTLAINTPGGTIPLTKFTVN